MKTITGINLFEAFKQLDRELPAEAYKAIGGGKGAKLGLTDIHPHFAYDLIAEIFGPLGVGWSYIITESKVEGGAGNYVATCTVVVSYTYIDDAEVERMSLRVYAPGGSDNSEIEWATKGALTNALGNAWSFLGLQRSVYKGLRGHKTMNPAPLTPRPAALPPSKPAPAKITADQIKALQTIAAKIQWNGASEAERRDARLKWLSTFLGRSVPSVTDLSPEEADKAIAGLRLQAGSK